MKSRWVVTTLIGLLLLFFLPLPMAGRVWRIVPDLAHAPSFAVIAGLLMRAAGRKARAISSIAVVMMWTGVVGAGAAIEFLQPLFGRQFSVSDILANAMGSAAGICWVGAGRSFGTPDGYRRGLCVFAALLLFAALVPPALLLADCGLQVIEMPRLASFEHRLELSRWSFQESRGTPVARNATHGSRSLRLDLDAGVYPGAALECPVRDWSGFDRLLFDITVDGAAPLDLVVKVNDAAHNYDSDDRFEKQFPLSPGSHTVEIDLAEVARSPRGRTMQMGRISFLQFFTVRPARTRTMFLDNVRLLRSED